MALRVYNTYNRRKEEFKPIEPGRVKMYVCGITAYDLCHVGHLRVMVVFDLIYRYLMHLGYQVYYVRNFTDVDDKIIARANQEGISVREVAEKYIADFYQDTAPFGFAPPTVEPKATDHIADMVAAIKGLQDEGYAYEIDGDVYYSVSKWGKYGVLSGKSCEALVAGARVEIDERKNDPLDFALWKKSKPGEPTWESPWGLGRPGWHIECSVMSQKYLGPSFDIHGGGQDLVFPHHENEIAQSEALTDKRFVNFWIHNGFVQINKEKMSKSTGNFFTIREVLKEFPAEALRLFFLSHHYRSPVEFSPDMLADSKKNLDYFYLLLRRLGEGSERAQPGTSDAGEKELDLMAETLNNGFQEAMNDDFNSALAISHFHEFTRRLNRFLDAHDRVSAQSLTGCRDQFVKLGSVLGILQLSIEEWFGVTVTPKSGSLGIKTFPPTVSISENTDWIEARIKEREQARRDRQWARADAIREELREKGIILEDTQIDTKWRSA
ncbi:MAG: cysteine--tRNA ligase [Thermodesulfobacteriota bacterium]